MTRLIIMGLLTLFAASCFPTPEEQQTKNQAVDRSFRCMWTGDCSN
jgi:hypothetical protein